MVQEQKTYEAPILRGVVDDRQDTKQGALEDAREQVARLIAEGAVLAHSNRRLAARTRDLEKRLQDANRRNRLQERTTTETMRLGDALRQHLDALQASQAELDDAFERVLATRQTLRSECERTHVTLHCLSEGVITTDAKGVIVYLNPVAESLTGLSLEEAQGRPIASVLRLRSESSGALVPPDLWRRCLTEDRPVRSDDPCELANSEGALFAIDYSAVPIRTDDGDPLGIAVILRDVTEARLKLRQITHDASHDPLTGLVNRREFERRLAQALASADSHHAVHILAFIDLDNFKIINDIAGHQAGDRLLRQLTGNVARNFRERDTFARLGGDEFALLLENCALEDAIRICEAVLASLRQSPLICQDRTISVTASIGLVAIAGSSGTPAELLARGDVACYAAKERGGDQVFVFEGDERSARRHRDISRASVLRNALDRDRLRLYFQPIVPLHEEHDHAAGIEVLLRCLDADNELIMPSALIPAAERYGLMRAVDRWVIESACQFLAGIQRNAPDASGSLGHLAINLSGSSVGDESLPSFLRQQFAAYDLPADHFCFEITETCAIHNLDLAAVFVRELQRIGCTVALDDFGSGLSSFSYLKALPVNFVKIDGSFVKDMLHNPVDHAVVVAIKDIAAMMGVQCVAEYVHSKELLACLRDLAVDFAQGNAIGAASPLDTFTSDHR